MRQPKGATLTDQEWQALQNTELDATQLERDPEAFLKETAGWFESSYLCSIVSMACYSRALASARRHEQTLFLCQAVDFCEQVAGLRQGELGLYKQTLAAPQRCSHQQAARHGAAPHRHARAHYNANSATMGRTRCNGDHHGNRSFPARQAACLRQRRRTSCCRNAIDRVTFCSLRQVR